MDAEKLADLAHLIVNDLDEYAVKLDRHVYGLPTYPPYREFLANIVIGHIAQAFKIDIRPQPEQGN